jgi:hypothetical protein
MNQVSNFPATFGVQCIICPAQYRWDLTKRNVSSKSGKRVCKKEGVPSFTNQRLMHKGAKYTP